MKAIRMYLLQGSCWLILAFPVKPNSDGLLLCLEKFVEQKRRSSAAWAFAESPQDMPHFAAPGFLNLVHWVEGLRKGTALDIPQLGVIKSSDLGSMLFCVRMTLINRLSGVAFQAK